MFALALLAAVVPVPGAGAADPTHRPPRLTCDERFPADGPAGIDLRLGCLVGEVVGTFTGTTDQGDPAPLSSYLEPLLITIVAVAAAVVALLLSRRLLGRRLAPDAPTEWWTCDACRSVNPGSGSRCYACGAPRPAADSGTGP